MKKRTRTMGTLTQRKALHQQSKAAASKSSSNIVVPAAKPDTASSSVRPSTSHSVWPEDGQSALPTMARPGLRHYGVTESLAEKKAQQAVEEKLRLRREIKEISSRVETMVNEWEEEEIKAQDEFPAQFAEAKVQ